jgi:hypothetical protein
MDACSSRAPTAPRSSEMRKLVAAQAGPRITRKVEQLIVRLAEENRDWGSDRIAGALANLGYQRSDGRRCPAAPVCRRRRSASARPPCRRSFGPTWRCWRARPESGDEAATATEGGLLRPPTLLAYMAFFGAGAPLVGTRQFVLQTMWKHADLCGYEIPAFARRNM